MPNWLDAGRQKGNLAGLARLVELNCNEMKLLDYSSLHDMKSLSLSRQQNNCRKSKRTRYDDQNAAMENQTSI